jgi:hypothetical protein
MFVRDVPCPPMRAKNGPNGRGYCRTGKSEHAAADALVGQQRGNAGIAAFDCLTTDWEGN